MLHVRGQIVCEMAQAARMVADTFPDQRCSPQCLVMPPITTKYPKKEEGASIACRQIEERIIGCSRSA